MKWGKSHTYVKDMVEVETSSHDYYDDTVEWLKSINAEIIELNQDSIIAKQVVNNLPSDFVPVFFWHKIIQILFTDDEEIHGLTIELSPASDYKDYVVDPYIHWRELVLDYYDFIDVKIDSEHNSKLFDEHYLRLLINQRATERRYVLIIMVSVFAFSVLLLVMGRLGWFFVTLFTFLLIGGVFGGLHSTYLEAIHYLNKIQDKSTDN